MPTPEAIRVSIVLPASAERLYRAFVDAKEHAAFTGAPATGSAKVGGKFSAWDGYITGKHLELHPHERIVQAWRTTDFPEDAPDSRLEILFQPASGGTRVTFVHTFIPPGQGAKYKAGWRRHYFAPMKRHFRADVEVEPAAPSKRPSVRTQAAAAKPRKRS